MEKRTLPRLAVVTSLVSLGLLAAVPVGAAQKVELTLIHPDVNCVSASPDPADVRKKGLGKTKRVKWVPTTDGYHWEITFSAKHGQTLDYLGAVPPIQCSGRKDTESGAASKDFPGALHWYYKISVYECVAGNKGNKICDADPMVRIKD